MTKIEVKMLSDLYQSTDGLYAFTFYTRYGIEAEDMFKFIDKFQGRGIITYQEDRICVTDEGKKVILKQHFHIQTKKTKFENIPIEFISQKIEINTPYLPNINYLSPEIIKIKKAD